MTDTELKIKGLQALVDALGPVDAGKFVAMINRERFDYTEWRKNHLPEGSIREISRAAMSFQKSLQGRKRKANNI